MWLEEALGKDDHAEPTVRAGALIARFYLRAQNGHGRAQACLEEPHAVRGGGDQGHIAESLTFLAIWRIGRGSSMCCGTLQSLAVARRSGN